MICCISRHVFPGLDAICDYSDPARTISYNDRSMQIEDVNYGLDRDLPDVCKFLTASARTRLMNLTLW